MPTYHKIVQGEYLAKIAGRYGFADFSTVWDHAGNAPLRQRRKSPNVLHPGDMLFIPDKQEKQQARATAQVHRFVVPRRTVLLRLVVKRCDGQPMAGTKCLLTVGDVIYPLCTSGEGMIEKEIPMAAERAKLTIPGENGGFTLRIGHLDPVEEASGWQSRLRNLGYYDGPGDAAPDDADLRCAVEEFQCDHGLSVDGLCGPRTQARLLEAHGC
jgi:hypothetical protein